MSTDNRQRFGMGYNAYTKMKKNIHSEQSNGMGGPGPILFMR